MHKSTLTQIYLLSGLIIASLVMLPIVFLFVLVNSASPEVDQTLLSTTEAQVDLYDPVGQPTITLPISKDWPANGYVAVEFGQEDGQISQSLVVVQPNQTDSVAVKSIYAGVVAEVDRVGEGDCGQQVVIWTESNLQIFYCSLRFIGPQFEIGQFVAQGEIIASMGYGSGFDQPHLVLTTEVSGVKVNPRHFLEGDPLIVDDLPVDF